MKVLQAVFLFGTVLLQAQEWDKATVLPAVDLTSLSAAQKTLALKMLREEGCTCGCNMKIAECRVKDPSCAYSKGLAAVVIQSVKEGKNEAEVRAAMAASPMGRARVAETRLLSDKVAIDTAGAPVTGPTDARITLVEFSDFQCPFCVGAVPQLQAVLKAYPTQVKLIFKEFPLETHSQAELAATAALAAHKQGKFWPMHDAIFALRGKISREGLINVAKLIQLDMKRFEADLNSPALQQAVAKDVAQGASAGVEGTPTLFVDGQKFNGQITLASLKPVLDAKLKTK